MRLKLWFERNDPEDKDFHITPALIFGQEELEEPVFMQVDGDYVPVPDGNYDIETEDGKSKAFSVTNGLVKNRKEYGIAISWGYWQIIFAVAIKKQTV